MSQQVYFERGLNLPSSFKKMFLNRLTRRCDIL